MGLFPRLKSKKERRAKGLKPVLIDVEKLAKREDVEAITKELQDAERKKLMQKIATLSPRKRRRLLKLIAKQKEVTNGKG